MEGGPRPEFLDQNPQPDLLEIFADREVEIFGMTGTFKELAALCPVDLSDPRVTLEAKNDFVAKAANEGGLAIEPEYKGIFDRVLQKNNLEPKYTIIKEAAPGKVEMPAKGDSAAKPEVPKVEKGFADAAEPLPKIDLMQLASPEPVNALASAEVENSKNQTVAPDDKRQKAINTLFKEVIEQVPETVKKIVAPAVEKAPPKKPPKAQPTVAKAIARLPIVRDPLPAKADVQPEKSVSQPANELQSDLPAIPDQYEILEPVAAAAEAAYVEPEPPYWSAELSKEPAEVYDDFIESLQIFAVKRAQTTAETESDSMNENGDSDTAEQINQLAPPIVLEVAGRLAELPDVEKEATALILKDIIGAVHGLDLLLAREAPPYAVEAVEAKLHELCIQLFDAIGLTYTERDVEQFMWVVKNPEFAPAKAEALELATDLEDIGTYESKWGIARLGSQVAHVSMALQRALGGIALVANSWE